MGRADIALVLLLPEVVDYISILFRNKEESACDSTELSHWNFRNPSVVTGSCQSLKN